MERIPVTALREFERVVLQCDCGRHTSKRDAVFLHYVAKDAGLYTLYREAFNIPEADAGLAVFLMQTDTLSVTPIQLRAVFRVNADGSLLDDEQRRILVVARVVAGQG